MANRKWLTSLVLLALTIGVVVPAERLAAQQTTYVVRGVVRDAATGQPLAGANVLLVGTQRGALTDNAGVYSFVAPVAPGTYTLQFTFIGRTTQTRSVTLGNVREVTVPPVSLAEQALALEELVVTGTAAPTSRKALGNSVATLSADKLVSAPAMTVDAALSGKIAGAQVVMNSGTPGGGVSVRLRGTSSIIGGAEPLYIVDGVIVDNSSDQMINFGYRTNPSNRLADLSPADIERIEVLKGAAAAALYGSRANNGVVQIFTKRGQTGKPNITVSTRTALETLPRKLDFNDYPFDENGNPVKRYDNQDLLFRNAWTQDVHVAVSGGTTDTKYYLSGGYTSQEGIMKGTDHEKINLRLNLDQAVSDWFRLSGGANYIRSNTALQVNGEHSAGGLLTAIVFTPTDIDLSAKDPETGRYLNQASSFPNPLHVIEDWSAPQTISRFVGSFQAQANPVEPLTVEYRVGYDTYSMQTSRFVPREAQTAPLGSSTAYVRDQYLINNDLVGSLRFAAGSALQFTSSLGMNHTYSKTHSVYASASDLSLLTELVRGAVQSASESLTETATLGFFAQQQVAFNQRLFLTGALRWDASSTFGPDERWQLYPKVSGSWVVSDEPFWQASPLASWIGNLRLRAALGYAGNQPPTGSAYARFTRYSQVTNINRLGLVPLAAAGNPDLKPERQREWEVGFDAGFWNDRLGIAFTYYDQYTKDLLLDKPFAPSTGNTTMLANVGELQNRGVELAVNTTNIDRTGFRWSSSLSFSANENMVKKLVGGAAGAFTVGYNNRVAEGHPLGEFFDYTYERDANGNIVLDDQGLPLRSVDEHGNPERVFLGDPNPDFVIGLSNEFLIGEKLSFSFLLDGSFGGKVWNQTLRIMDRFMAGPLYERQLRGEVTDAYRLRYYTIVSEYLEDGTFVKVREATLRYTWDRPVVQRMGLRSVDLELTGRNLYTFTDYRGYDPEVNMFGSSTVERGVDFAVYPIPRSVALGIRVSY